MAGICNLCGLPDELCICQEIAKEQQSLVGSRNRSCSKPRSESDWSKWDDS